MPQSDKIDDYNFMFSVVSFSFCDVLYILPAVNGEFKVAGEEW